MPAKTNKPSKTAALANLRTGKKGPKMPEAPATIEAEETAAAVADDAEVEAAAARFSPAAVIEVPEPAASEETDEEDDDDGLDEDDGDDDAEPASGAPLVAADGTSLAGRTPSEARQEYLKKLREDGPARMKAFTIRKVLRIAMKKASRNLGTWAKDKTRGEELAKVATLVDNAVNDLTAACLILEAIPKDWRPESSARKWKGGGKVELVGQTCRIADKARGQFKDLLEPAEMDALVVKALAGKVYACITTTGTKVFLPRGALVPVEAKDAPPASAPPASEPPASARPADDDDVLGRPSSRPAPSPPATRGDAEGVRPRRRTGRTSPAHRSHPPCT